MATASLKPSVVKSAVLAPLRSIRALVTSVVPWIIVFSWSAATSSRSRRSTNPSSTASEGSSGVVRTLPTARSPVASARRTMSVNVPPMSMPTRWCISERNPHPSRPLCQAWIIEAAAAGRRPILAPDGPTLTLASGPATLRASIGSPNKRGGSSASRRDAGEPVRVKAPRPDPRTRVFDLEQPRTAGMPIHPAHEQAGYSYLLHRHHEDEYRPEEEGPRTGAAGIIICAEHTGTHIDALCHQADALTLYGGVRVDPGVQ